MFSKNVIISIEGMHCSNCAKRVEDALKKIKGVKSIKVDLESKKANLKCLKSFQVSDINGIIEDLGFKCVSVVEE